MNLFKSLTIFVLISMLGVFLGCSGEHTTASPNHKTTGKSLVDDLQITSDNLDQGQPSVAYDTDNNRYMVVWQHITAAGSSEIRGRLYAGSGTGTSSAMTPVAAEFVINASGATRQQPKVAYCNDGINARYLVVWSDSRGGYGQIYGRNFDKDGNPLAADFSISTHDAANTNQIDADLIYNTVLKKFIVAWVDTTNNDNSNNPANILTIKGTYCKNSTTVSYIPLPVVDNYLIRSVEVTPATAVITNIQNWSALLLQGDVAYTETPGTGGSYKQLWTAFSDESRPKLIFSNADGTYYAAWSGTNSTVTLDGAFTAVEGGEVVAKSKVGGGNFIAGDTVSIAAPYQISAISITLPNGTVANSYSVTGLNTNNIVILVAEGSNMIGESSFMANLTYYADDTCTYKPVTFTAAASSGQLITTMKNDDLGLGLSKYYTFGTAGATSPTLALDPNTNRMLLVWEDAGQTISGQLIDLATFNNYGSTIPVTTSKGTSPVVSFDNVNQRFLVAWEDARNSSANLSNMDIYAQFIDPQGQLSGGNSIVTVAPGNQLAPALVFGGVNFRQFMIVWKDGRALGNSDVWGQTIEFSNSPQLVVSDSTGSPILTGSIDFGNVTLGQTKDITLKLRNDGNTQLTINQDSLKTIVPESPYTLLTPMPVTISPGNSYNLVVRFAPTAIGSYAGTSGNNFKLQIDSNGGQSTTYFNGAGTGTDSLAITTASLPDGTPGVAYAATKLTAFGGIYPYTSWIAVGLPAGLSLDPISGIISGTPTAPLGTYPINITLTDKAGTSVSRLLTIKISVISISTNTLNSGTNGLLYSQTVTATGGATPFSWTIAAGSLPNGLGIALLTGEISGLPTVSGPFNFTVQVTDKNGAISTKPMSITIQQSALLISTAAVSDMKTNVPMSITLQATGGTLPYTWALTSGAFPTGVSTFDMNGGNLSGTPTVAGDFSFDLTVTDSVGSTATRTYTVSVRDPLNITTPTLKSWAFNQSGYADTLTAMGGRGTYTWTVTAGSLPAGLSLNSASGVISGTPTAAGIYPITIQVADTGAVPEAVTKNFTIIISTAMVISNTSAPTTTKYAPYTLTLTAPGGTEPKTWSSTNLPSALHLNAQTGVVSGYAAEVGVASIIFTVTDYTGGTASQTLTIDVKPDVQITTSSIKSWTQGVGGYNDTLTAIGGVGPYKWEWGVGYPPPPAGLVLNPATGQITGTPTNVSTSGYSFRFQVTDANGAIASGLISNFVVNPAMTNIMTSFTPATPGIVYQTTLGINGGTAPFSWGVQSGALPHGLTLDPLTGIISGIPTTPEASQFSIQVTDATGDTQIQALSLVVAPTLVITSNSTLPAAHLNSDYSEPVIATGGRPPYTWAVISGSLPTGLTPAPATGIISGKVTAPGSYTFEIQVTDADGRIATQTPTISTSFTNIPPPTLTIVTTTLPAGEINKVYNTMTLIASGGTAPRTWSLISGELPPGISMASATGIISGTPTAGGKFDVIIQVQDADLKSTTQSLSIVVIDPTVSGTSLQFTDGISQLFLLGFGNAYKGTLNSKTVVLKNLTDSLVRIASVSSDSTAFTVPGGAFSIPANGTANLDISFIPSKISGFSGIITITDMNGIKNQLPVTGSGIGINVELKSSTTDTAKISFLNSVSTASLPTKNKPVGFITQAAADFQITGVEPGSTVKVAVTFAYMPTNPVFYKIVGDKWIEVKNPTVSLSTVTFDITDDSDLDSDKTPGIISDPIVVGTNGGGTGTTTDNTPPATSGGGGGGCFIATAAFGSYLDPHVMVLRHFRDNVLLQSDMGTAFVHFYYKYSPPIADFIAQHDSLRTIFRFTLTPLIFGVEYPLAAGFIFTLAIAWYIRRRLGVKPQKGLVQQ